MSRIRKSGGPRPPPRPVSTGCGAPAPDRGARPKSPSRTRGAVQDKFEGTPKGRSLSSLSSELLDRAGGKRRTPRGGQAPAVASGCGSSPTPVSSSCSAPARVTPRREPAPRRGGSPVSSGCGGGSSKPVRSGCG